MKLSKEELEKIKKFGNIVSKTHDKNPSLLYKLDRARNDADFWSAMREISKGLTMLKLTDLKMTTPGAVEDIVQITNRDGIDWEEIRDLIVMYSSMSIAKARLARGD